MEAQLFPRLVITRSSIYFSLWKQKKKDLSLLAVSHLTDLPARFIMPVDLGCFCNPRKYLQNTWLKKYLLVLAANLFGQTMYSSKLCVWSN